MKKRILSFITLLCMVTTLLPANITAFASTVDSGTCGDNITWELDDSGTLTISGTGEMPNWIAGRATPWNTWSNEKKITNVIIGNGITSIGDSAFEELPNLKSVTLNGDIQYIGKYAFNRCFNLKMRKLVLPNSVTTIEDSAFFGCNISIIELPNSVSYIGEKAFAFSENLEEIRINNEYYTFSNGCLYDSKKTKLLQCIKSESDIIIPNSVKTIGRWAFYFYNGDDGSITIPCTVTIPKTITEIESLAFWIGGLNITNVYYNGTESEWNNISIDSSNDKLTNAARTYFAYINISDKDGNKVIDTTQNMGEYIDTSSIAVPKGYKAILFTDQALTESYPLDTPISENLNLYYDIIEVNQLKITGVESADIGQKGITESVSFATDKTAKDFVATIKYSDKLNLSEVKAKDFTIEQSSETNGDYTYLYLTCAYKNDGNMPKNTTLNPFDLVFDVSESATANENLTIEFVDDETFLADSGSNTYDFDGFGTAEIKVNPILVKSITINGADEIDQAKQYTTTISPENATNKDIEWSVDNSEIATISTDGTLTPKKAGTVKITATAKDGSGIYGEKSVNVKVYAQITSISANVGEWNKTFTPSEREYTIYVPKNTASIKLKPQYNGTLKLGTQTLYNNRNNNITLSNLETVLTLNYSETGYTNSTYTIKIVKFEGTQTTVSEDGKVFTVKPINIEKGNTVILGLYKGDTFVGMEEPKVYNGEDVIFTTTKDYTNAKVMVWDSLGGMIPICEAEEVE